MTNLESAAEVAAPVVPAAHELTRTTEHIDCGQLLACVTELLESGWRLVLVAAQELPTDEGFRVTYSFLGPVGARHEVAVHLPKSDPMLPTLASVSFAAGRFEREIADLYGIGTAGHPISRRLVRHRHWPADWFPMLRDADPEPAFGPDNVVFHFDEVSGAGVYEIPVGPIHAGLIEPGHFRFSVVGETILQMQARLWFMHRGVEKLFHGRTPNDGIELAERVSGDTAIGHTLAYVLAVEEAAGIGVSEHDQLLRALLLEVERLYSHTGDLGAIVNDVAYGVGYAHALRLRESLLRHNKALTGHRLLRGAIGVGTTQLQNLPDVDLLHSVADQVAELVTIAEEHHIITDRLEGTSVLPYDSALNMGTLGYVARASGVDIDARRDYPFVNLGSAFVPALETRGDVQARFRVRAHEFRASMAVIDDIMTRLPHADTTIPARQAAEDRCGLGVVEAWRGLLTHRVALDADGRLARVKVADPSFFNWPALSVALKDTIVPDFPLTNKSFNLSYAGNDL